MALGFYFAPQSMSADQYDEVTRRLEEAGQGAPAGRIYHVAFSGAGGVNVPPTGGLVVVTCSCVMP